MLSSLNNTGSDLHSQGVSQASRERERPESHAESTHPQGVTTTSLQRERSQSRVESSHPQGVAPTSLERESSQSHVVSLFPQGVAPTFLLRESSASHVDSQARSATGSSDVLDLVSRRRSTASRRPSFAPSATAAQAGEGSGDARTRLWFRSVGDGEVARMAVTRIRHQRHQCKLRRERAWCPRRRSMRLWPRRIRRPSSGPLKFFTGFDNAWKWNRRRPFGPTWHRCSSD